MAPQHVNVALPRSRHLTTLQLLRSAGEAADVPQKARELAEKVIRRNKDHSLFLVTMKARLRTATTET